jgi:ketosteroid isomerase-like protein
VNGLRERVQQWFDGYDGPMSYEIGDLAVAAAYDVAFCWGLHHVAGTTKTGQKIDMWWRATQGFRRVDGKWRIVHEHGSVPFDMKSGKVSFDLKP